MPSQTESFAHNGPILLVGAGKMGMAMLEGWLVAGIASSNVRVVETNPAAELVGLCCQQSIHLSEMAGSTAQQPSVIVMAVKPQVMAEVFPQIAKLAGPNTVTLSIAAGKTIAGFEAHLPPNAAVVRAMPNTPAAIGRGMAVLCANGHVSPSQRALCERLMAAVGDVGWVADEGLMDVVTAVSGSGPAYVFLLTEALTEAGIKAGLDPALAARLARVTVSGSGELLHRSPLEAAKLRENVTSPGGTTAAALAVLMAPNDGLTSLMERAVKAAVERGKWLSK